MGSSFRPNGFIGRGNWNIFASEKKLFAFSDIMDADQDYIRDLLTKRGQADLVPAKPEGAPSTGTASGTPPMTSPGSSFPTPGTTPTPGYPGSGSFPRGPGAASGFPPGAYPGTTPGATPSTFPGSNPGTNPGAFPGSTSGAFPGSTSGSAFPNAAGMAGSSAGNPSPYAPPGADPASTSAGSLPGGDQYASSFGMNSGTDPAATSTPSYELTFPTMEPPTMPDVVLPQLTNVYECENCKAEVSESAKVCPKCGVTFDYQVNPDGSRTQLSNSSNSGHVSGRGIAGLVKIVILIVVGIGGLCAKLSGFKN